MARRLFFFIMIVMLPVPTLADTLRVGISPDYPPLAYKQEGRIVGIEADNARAVAEVLGSELKLVEMPFAELIPALEAGKIDIIMSGLSITKERSKRVLYAEPYLNIGQMAITLITKAGRFLQPWSIYQDDTRLGVEPDTTGAEFVAREIPQANVQFYADPEMAFEALRNDNIDLYIHDAPTSWRLATTQDNADLISLYHPLTEESLAWAVAPGNTGLLVRLNNAQVKLRSNGTLAYILNRWIPVTIAVK